MPYNAQIADINLETLSWDNDIYVTGGGGFDSGPSVRPFLWTVFFTIDGTTMSVSDLGELVGTPTIYPSAGSHGTLGWDDLTPGNQRGIPDALGHWTQNIVPIPVAPSLQSIIGVNQPATVGVVAVALIDGGHIPKHAIEAGHAELNTVVAGALAQLVADINPSHRSITSADIAAATDGLADKITDAVKDALSTLQKIWALTDADSLIGYTVLHWSQDDFSAANGQVAIVGEPDDPNNPDPTKSSGIISPAPDQWSFRGYASEFDPCPAEAVNAVLQGFLDGVGAPAPRPSGGGRHSAALAAMRRFRDEGGFAQYPGLETWWRAAEASLPSLVRLLACHADARRAATSLFAHIAPVLGDPAAQLSSDVLESAQALLGAVTEKGSPRLRSLATQALSAIKGSSFPTGHSLLRALQERPAR